MHVMHILEATAGGARKHLSAIATGLRQEGVTVDLVVSPLGADPDFQRDLDALRKIGCRVFLVDMEKGPSLADFGASRAIGRALAERRPQIVHTHCAKAGLLGRLAARKYPQIKVVHTPHSFFFQGLKGPLRRRLGVGLERWLGTGTHRMFCISETEREAALARGLVPPHCCLVGLNGLSPGFYENLLSREQARRRLNVPERIFAIGVFARLVPRKGHAWLLHNFAAMPASDRKNLRLYLVGNGPLREPIEALIEELDLRDHVVLTAYEPGAERVLPGFDLGVLPSSYEGLSYQLLETLGAGLPLIATDVPGNKLLEAGNPILYVQPESGDELIALIQALQAEPERCRQLGEQGRRFVQQHFRQEEQLRQLLACYRGLLADDDLGEQVATQVTKVSGGPLGAPR